MATPQKPSKHGSAVLDAMVRCFREGNDVFKSASSEDWVSVADRAWMREKEGKEELSSAPLPGEKCPSERVWHQKKGQP